MDVIDIDTVLRDLSDNIRTESDPERRILLYDAMLQAASDIARDGFLSAVYALRAGGMPAKQIAERHEVHHFTVTRWTNEYAEAHGLPRLGRQPRVVDATPIQPHYKAGLRRRTPGTPIPGE
jgi:hypothetical protein